jgi:acetyltransferase
MKRLFSSRAFSALSQLDAGKRLLLRPITVSDRSAYLAFITKLSAQTKYQRTLGGVIQPSAEALTHLLSPDLSEQVVLGIFVTSLRSKETLAAVGRIARSDTSYRSRSTAEFAITVADEYQGEGMGTTLLKALTLEATRLGYGALVATVFTNNQAMLALGSRQGFAVENVAGDAALKSIYCTLAGSATGLNIRTPMITPEISNSIPHKLIQSGMAARQR